MNWLRLHHEARTDKKLAALTDAQFRVWFNLLCFSGEQVDRGTVGFEDIDVLAVEVAGGDTELLQATIERLTKLKMIESDEGEITFRNFEKRQYDKPSDTPERVSERVRNHRERQRNADVTPRNAIDTETEAKTEPESETERTENETLGQNGSENPPSEPDPPAKTTPSELEADYERRFYGPYPRHVKRDDGLRAWAKLKPAERDAAAAGLARWLEAAAFAPEMSFVPHPASWLNAGRWKDDVKAVNPPKPFEWPEWLRKRIDVHLQECAVNKCDPEPYPVDLKRDMDAYAKSVRAVA